MTDNAPAPFGGCPDCGGIRGYRCPCIPQGLFDRAKKRLKTEWGYDLFRGSPDQLHGYKTGFFVTGPLFEQRFDTLKKLIEALDRVKE